MKFRNNFSISEAKEIDLVHFLSDLGYEPSKIRENDYWYLSPLRDEKTPSFKINRKLNCWYDHGLGKGGNLVDFAILYHGCSLSELLQKLSDNLSFQKPIFRQPFVKHEQKNRITARPFMENHKAVRPCLDRDTTGQNCSQYALSLGNQYKSQNSLCKNYKNFND